MSQWFYCLIQGDMIDKCLRRLIQMVSSQAPSAELSLKGCQWLLLICRQEGDSFAQHVYMQHNQMKESYTSTPSEREKPESLISLQEKDQYLKKVPKPHTLMPTLTDEVQKLIYNNFAYERFSLIFLFIFKTMTLCKLKYEIYKYLTYKASKN